MFNQYLLEAKSFSKVDIMRELLGIGLTKDCIDKQSDGSIYVNVKPISHDQYELSDNITKVYDLVGKINKKYKTNYTFSGSGYEGFIYNN